MSTSLLDGTANFAVIDVRGSGFKVTSYKSRREMLNSICSVVMLDGAKAKTDLENITEKEWREIMEAEKAKLLSEQDVEMSKAIEAEF